MFELRNFKKLTQKPTEDMFVQHSVIKKVSIEKNFHFGGSLMIDVRLEDCGFLGNLRFHPLHLCSIISLLLELFKDNMNGWESLSLDDLNNQECMIVWENEPSMFGSNKILAIGNLKGEYMFIDEVCEVINKELEKFNSKN